MTATTTIQIILILIVLFASLFGQFEKLFPNDLIKPIRYAIIILIFITCTLSILLELLKADKELSSSRQRDKDHKQYIDSLQKIIQKTDSALVLSDSTIRAQSKILITTDSTLQISNNISLGTKRILDSTSILLVQQNESLLNYKRDKNPLFPILIRLDIAVGFDNYIVSNKLQKVMDLKRNIELKNENQDSTISIGWGLANNKRYINWIGFSSSERILNNTRDESERFIRNLTTHLFIVDKSVDNLSQALSKTPILQGNISNHSTKMNVLIRFDFIEQKVHFILTSDGISLQYPKERIPMTINDLIKKYILVIPEGVCDYEIPVLQIISGKYPSNVITLVFNKSNDLVKSNEKDDCPFYQKIITKKNIFFSTRNTNANSNYDDDF